MALLFYYYVRKNQVKKLSQLKNLTEIFRKFIILTNNNISAIKAFQTAGVLFGPIKAANARESSIWFENLTKQ
ncbi:TPA: hypothetical protein ACQM8Z_000329 [Streptococcus pyogenes]|uniref:hypothetical protein n=1 Tax=Streptococcus pyogenes TaxID=1314 RepID=UPI002DD7A301|nr:hypothetical protein [Streptococcus pyogenes]WSE62156.1 hypothetical protein VKP56_03375 [Streptococcus pyogenes]